MNNRRSWLFSSEPFAGVGVAYSHREETEAEGQHDDVQHEMLLATFVSGRDHYCAFQEQWVAIDQEQ